jgi:Protein of unknwon function (DUF3310)
MEKIMAKRSASLTAKIRKYLAKNPNAKAKEISDATGATVNLVHNTRWAEKKKAKTLISGLPVIGQGDEYEQKGNKWKVVGITTASKSIKADMEADAQFEKDQDKRRAQGWQGQHVEGKFVAVPVGFNGTTLDDLKKAWNKVDNVNHPAHYKVGGIETIDFIEAKKLNYNLGNVIKYITRADHKGDKYEDLCKARWYLNREIANLQGKEE